MQIPMYQWYINKQANKQNVLINKTWHSETHAQECARTHACCDFLTNFVFLFLSLTGDLTHANTHVSMVHKQTKHINKYNNTKHSETYAHECACTHVCCDLLANFLFFCSSAMQGTWWLCAGKNLSDPVKTTCAAASG